MGDSDGCGQENPEASGLTGRCDSPTVCAAKPGADPAGSDSQASAGSPSPRYLEALQTLPTTDSMDMGLGGLRELVMDGGPGVLRFMGLQRVGHDRATELNSF